MHLIGQNKLASISYLFFLQQTFVQSHAANLLRNTFLNFLPILRLGWSIWGFELWRNSIFLKWYCFGVYVAYLFSCFGNSKMVTALQPKPISMDFGSPKRGEVLCVEVMVQVWIGQKKKSNLAEISYLFFLQLRFDQSYAANLLRDIFLNFLPISRIGWSIWGF